MKKSLVFFLLLAAVVFVFSPAALASPFDGTWKLESATLDERYDGQTWTGSVPSTDPAEFKIIMDPVSGNYYNMLFNYDDIHGTAGIGDGVLLNWAITPDGGHPSAAGYRNTMFRLESVAKLSETEYTDPTGTGNESYVLVDDSTIKITKKRGDDQYHFNYEYIFKRVGASAEPTPINPNDPPDITTPGTTNPTTPGTGSGGGGGGCSTFGLGFGMTVLIGGLFAAKRGRNAEKQ